MHLPLLLAGLWSVGRCHSCQNLKTQPLHTLSLDFSLICHPSSHPPPLHPPFRSSHPSAGSHFLVQAHSSLQLWGSPEGAQGFSCCRPVLMTTLHPNVVSCGSAGTERWCLRIGPMFLSLLFFILSSSPWDYE